MLGEYYSKEAGDGNIHLGVEYYSKEAGDGNIHLEESGYIVLLHGEHIYNS